MNDAEWKLEVEKRKKTVWLEITTWRDVSLGASHFYGMLNAPCDCRTNCNCKRRVELERVLTASEAKELTKIQNDNSLFDVDYRWEKGDTTKSFDDKESIEILALDTFQIHFPDRTRLVLGSPVYCGPEKILVDFR